MAIDIDEADIDRRANDIVDRYADGQLHTLKQMVKVAILEGMGMGMDLAKQVYSPKEQEPTK